VAYNRALSSNFARNIPKKTKHRSGSKKTKYSNLAGDIAFSPLVARTHKRTDDAIHKFQV